LFCSYIHFLRFSDPALAPTKAIQNIQALDDSHWQQQPRARFDTTYRTEFINRIRHPVRIVFENENLDLFVFLFINFN